MLHYDALYGGAHRWLRFVYLQLAATRLGCFKFSIWGNTIKERALLYVHVRACPPFLNIYHLLRHLSERKREERRYMKQEWGAKKTFSRCSGKGWQAYRETRVSPLSSSRRFWLQVMTMQLKNVLPKRWQWQKICCSVDLEVRCKSPKQTTQKKLPPLKQKSQKKRWGA